MVITCTTIVWRVISEAIWLKCPIRGTWRTMATMMTRTHHYLPISMWESVSVSFDLYGSPLPFQHAHQSLPVETPEVWNPLQRTMYYSIFLLKWMMQSLENKCRLNLEKHFCFTKFLLSVSAMYTSWARANKANEIGWRKNYVSDLIGQFVKNTSRQFFGTSEQNCSLFQIRTLQWFIGPPHVPNLNEWSQKKNFRDSIGRWEFSVVFCIMNRNIKTPLNARKHLVPKHAWKQ